MPKKLAARTAQYPLCAEFTFNFDDTMLAVSGGTAIAGSPDVDFGKTNIAATIFKIIPLPIGATVVGGSVTTDVAFDTLTYMVTVGDSVVANRYLASTDKKGLGLTALVPTGFVGEGEDIRVGITNADVCTTGKMTVRVEYTMANRSNEVQV